MSTYLRQNSDKSNHSDEIQSKKDLRLKFTLWGGVSFIVALSSKVTMSLYGEIYLVELLLFFFTFGLYFFYKTKLHKVKVYQFFLFSIFISLFSYIVSDLAMGTPNDLYLKGWARFLFVASDFTALVLLVLVDKRNIWFFLTGFSLGAIGYLYFIGVPFSEWKFGYGGPVIIFTCCIVVILPWRIASLVVVVLGGLCILLDSRVQGATCILIGAIIWLRSSKPKKAIEKPLQLLRLTLVAVVAGGILIYIMDSSQDNFSSRRASSNIHRIVAISYAFKAIIDSPIIGHGSWAKDSKLARKQYAELQSKLSKEGRRAEYNDSLRAHSQILQSWVEGGFFGMTFFILFGYLLLHALYYTSLVRQLDIFSPVFLYYIITAGWHLIASPFGGGHRMIIAIAVTVLCILYMEKSNE